VGNSHNQGQTQGASAPKKLKIWHVSPRPKMNSQNKEKLNVPQFFTEAHISSVGARHNQGQTHGASAPSKLKIL